MARGEMLTVFSYDISSNRIRRRVASILEDAASRVQGSVFEARLTKRHADAVAVKVASLLEDDDSLRVYVISADGLQRSKVYGSAVPFEPAGDYWLL